MYTLITYTFTTQISPAYAPEGKSLASVTLIGHNSDLSDSQLDVIVKKQLTQWWGESVGSWELLRVYRYYLIFGIPLVPS